MKFYYYIENDEKKGPFTLLEKDEILLSQDTLIWEESFDEWKKAGELPELNDFFIKHSPPTHSNSTVASSTIGYGSLEDISGINYRNAILVTGAYIAITLFYNSFFYNFIGFFVWFILPIVIWKYFKTFFKSLGDHKTAKFINYIILSYCIYFISYIIFKIMLGTDMVQESMIELIVITIVSFFDPSINPELEATKTFLVFAILGLGTLFGSLIAVIISGINVMKADKNYDFPLKSIATASMICLPLTFLSYVSAEDEINMFWRIIHMIPYLFLFQHFYNAEKLDKTQE